MCGWVPGEEGGGTCSISVLSGVFSFLAWFPKLDVRTCRHPEASPRCVRLSVIQLSRADTTPLTFPFWNPTFYFHIVTWLHRVNLHVVNFPQEFSKSMNNSKRNRPVKRNCLLSYPLILASVLISLTCSQTWGIFTPSHASVTLLRLLSLLQPLISLHPNKPPLPSHPQSFPVLSETY